MLRPNIFEQGHGRASCAAVRAAAAARRRRCSSGRRPQRVGVSEKSSRTQQRWERSRAACLRCGRVCISSRRKRLHKGVPLDLQHVVATRPAPSPPSTLAPLDGSSLESLHARRGLPGSVVYELFPGWCRVLSSFLGVCMRDCGGVLFLGKSSVL